MSSKMTTDECMLRFSSMVLRAGLDEKSYQQDGVRWAIERERDSIKGGIIADEMGLGKTIVAIGLFYSHVFERTLVVLPVALLSQWSDAIVRFTGMKPLLYHGSKRGRITEDAFMSAHIVITTYDIVTIDSDKNDSLLHTTRWGRIMYDEAHHLRNSNTIKHKACAALTANIVWAITGTPLQNRVSDFYSLCRIIGFEERMYRTSDKEARKQFTDTYVLKRTKVGVGIALPPLQMNDIVVRWTNSTEKQVAIDLHKELDFSKAGGVEDVGIHVNVPYAGNHCTIVSMIRARQACVLPEMIFRKHSRALKNVSSKIDKVVTTILSKKDNGSGKLVFCHYIQEIDKIKELLIAGGVQKVNTYDGRNSGNKGAFDKADVLILQIQTGCEGLNLQENYSEIYFVSPHWNPAIEDQAIARCYRIGQQKPVYVYRFVMDNFHAHSDQFADQFLEEEEEGVEEPQERDVEGDPSKTINIENYVKQVQMFKRVTCRNVI